MPTADECLAAAELEEEHEHVEGDQDYGDDGERPALCVVVANREHQASQLSARRGYANVPTGTRAIP